MNNGGELSKADAVAKIKHELQAAGMRSFDSIKGTAKVVGVSARTLRREIKEKRLCAAQSRPRGRLVLACQSVAQWLHDFRAN